MTQANKTESNKKKGMVRVIRRAPKTIINVLATIIISLNRVPPMPKKLIRNSFVAAIDKYELTKKMPNIGANRNNRVLLVPATKKV